MNLATKTDVEILRADMHKEFATFARWGITILIAVQVPTWTGIVGILILLLTKHWK